MMAQQILQERQLIHSFPFNYIIIFCKTSKLKLQRKSALTKVKNRQSPKARNERAINDKKKKKNHWKVITRKGNNSKRYKEMKKKIP